MGPKNDVNDTIGQEQGRALVMGVFWPQKEPTTRALELEIERNIPQVVISIPYARDRSLNQSCRLNLFSWRPI